MKNKKSRKGLWIALVIAVLVGVGGFTLLSGNATTLAASETTARTGNIATFYSFAGVVTVKNDQALTATESAKVRETYVEEGDLVKKNDRLLRLSSGVIKAGMAGEITSLPVEAEDDVLVGDLLVELVDFIDLTVEMKVDEFDMPYIKEGMEVQLTIQATGETFRSPITHISKQATLSGDIAYYIAKVDVAGREDMLPGMQVDAKVPRAYAENVVLLPMGALNFDEKNQPYVQVKEPSGSSRKQPVKLGVNDGIDVEILSGLSAGDVVEVPAAAAAGGIFTFEVGEQEDLRRNGGVNR